MAFKISARTVIQLGAELISSDAIAFYELIKNAFDAGSENIIVRVVIRINNDEFNQLVNMVHAGLTMEDTQQNSVVKDVKARFVTSVDSTSYGAVAFKERIRLAEDLPSLLTLMNNANFIRFSDFGEGMSLTDLDEIYLTIGTSSRKNLKMLPENRQGREHKALGIRRPILGEKGLGRLSVMRLGDRVKIRSTKSGELRYNVLDIDWAVFLENSESPLQDIEIAPVEGPRKQDPSSSGTSITVYGLKTNWSESLLAEITKGQISKFSDPFQRLNRKFMSIWFNNEPIPISDIKKLLFENAHAYCEAELSFPGGVPTLSGTTDYLLFSKTKSFSHKGEHLTSIASQKLSSVIRDDQLQDLGPFKMKLYWFNNGIVKAIDGIGKIKDVRQLIKEWAGGLMVYRDGFRIFPYGGFEDDWLKLDDVAFSSGGYKVNRRQVVGKVDISAIDNPKLIDQTNREGLRDCPEKRLLVVLLQHIIWTEFKAFLQLVEKDRLTNVPLDLDEIEDKMEENHQKLSDNLDFLVAKYPDIQKEKRAVDNIRQIIVQNRAVVKDAVSIMDSYKSRNDVTIHLAGLGLMVDIVAHELNRTTKHALSTIDSIDDRELTIETQSIVNSLQIQLKALSTRLKVLDPLGPSGRNTKTTFSLQALLQQTKEFHTNQFERHSINFELNSIGGKEWRIKAVEGMFVQILENLIANSVYWLKVRQSRNPQFKPKISVTLDKENQIILFEDNGPGIPIDRIEDVFHPFVTTKPPGDGKGLGLYISREIAKYHNIKLYLDSTRTDGSHVNTFVLDLTTLK